MGRQFVGIRLGLCSRLRRRSSVLEPVEDKSKAVPCKGEGAVGFGRAPERLSGLRHVATIESIGSSTRIEGVKLTDREVEKLLSNPGSQSFANRDEEEVAGYASVMETVFEHAGNIPLTVNYIQQLHGQLLQYSEKDVRHRGQYKTLSNSVEAFNSEGDSVGVVFQTA